MADSLTVQERYALLAPWAAVALAEAGVRTLVIKGQSLEAQGLREPRGSNDVDLWIGPDDVETATRVLARHGWRPDGEHEAAFIYPLHSTTFTHQFWRIEIDVHHEFPGFLADPRAVFDTVWADRVAVAIGGRDVLAPEIAAHAAVMALHLLRHPGPATQPEAIQSLAEGLAGVAGFDGRRLAEVSAATGSATSLRPLLTALGQTGVVDAVPVDPRRADGWRVQTQVAEQQTTRWLYELRRTSWRRWPGVLRRAVLLSEDEIRLKQPDTPPGWWGLQRARLRRLRWGLRALPAAVRQSRSAERPER